jgi:tripartite-type tricarboxylate transporter receptor subunit TctC
MSITKRRALTGAILGIGAAFSPRSGAAQGAWPGNQPVRIVYPFTPGGPGDAYARLLAEHFARAFGGSFVVENRTGASGTIATAHVANSAPDGRTLIMNSNSSQVIAPLVLRDPGFDPERSLVPIVRMFSYGMYLVVGPHVPARNVAEFVAWAKSRPRGVNMASVGMGSGGHLTAELFRRRAGFEAEHIPYRGGSAAIVALSTGEADYMFDSVGNSQPFVADGRAKGLAVTGARRAPAVPNVPTLDEAGFPGFHHEIWFGLLAPAATPPALVVRLNEEANRFLADPAFRQRLAQNAHEPIGGTPQEFSRYMTEDIVRWREVVQTVGVRGE